MGKFCINILLAQLLRNMGVYHLTHFKKSKQISRIIENNIFWKLESISLHLLENNFVVEFVRLLLKEYTKYVDYDITNGLIFYSYIFQKREDSYFNKKKKEIFIYNKKYKEEIKYY